LDRGGSGIPAADDRRIWWTARAEELDRRGHFRNYPGPQRREVLAKGFLGSWRPDRAVEVALTEFRERRALRTPKFNDELRDCFGLVGEELRRAVLAVLAEAPWDSYQPPAELREPPGYPYVFPSKTLGCRVYLKFQISGSARKPRVLFWSCHPAGRE
jgi:hypothetical protein